MIFTTNKDAKTNKFADVMGVAGTSFNDMGQKKYDIGAVEEFNRVLAITKDSVKATTSAQDYLVEHNRELSDSFKLLIGNGRKTAITTDEISLALQKSSKFANLAAIGYKALGMAMNTITTLVVSTAITKLIELIALGIDKAVVTVKELEEAAEEARTKYEQQAQVVNELNSELESTQQLIDELESKGALSIVEEEELERLKEKNTELERQYELEQRLLEIRQREAREATTKAVTKKLSNARRFRLSDAVKRVMPADDYEKEYRDAGAIDEFGQIDEYALEKEIKLNQSALKVAQDTYEKNVQERLRLIDRNADLEEIEEIDKTIDQNLRDINAISEDLADQRDSLATSLEGLDPVLDPTTESDKQFNAIFDLVDSIDNSILESGVADTLESELNYIKEAYSDGISNIQKVIDREGKIDADELEKSFPEIVEAFKKFGYEDINEIARILSETLKNDVKSISDSIGYSLDTTKEKAKTYSESIETILSALSGQDTTQSITPEAYSEIIALAPELASALERTATGWQINKDAAWEYIEAQNALQKKDAILAIDDIGEKLTVLEEIYRRSPTDSIKEQIEYLKEQRNQYGLLISQINNATSAYSKWVAAQSTEDQGAMFNEAKNMYEYVKENRKIGKTGTDDFAAAVEYALGEGWEARYKSEAVAYEAAEKKLKRYFGQEKEFDGAINMAKDLAKAMDEITFDDGVLSIADGTSFEKMAESIGVSQDALRALFGLLEDYDISFDWNEELSDEEVAWAKSLNAAEKGVNEQVALINKLKAERASIQEDGIITFEEKERLEQINAELETAATKAEKYNEQITELGGQAVEIPMTSESDLEKAKADLATIEATLGSIEEGTDVHLKLTAEAEALMAEIKALEDGLSVDVSLGTDSQQSASLFTAGTSNESKARAPMSTDVQANTSLLTAAEVPVVPKLDLKTIRNEFDAIVDEMNAALSELQYSVDFDWNDEASQDKLNSLLNIQEQLMSVSNITIGIEEDGVVNASEVEAIYQSIVAQIKAIQDNGNIDDPLKNTLVESGMAALETLYAIAEQEGILNEIDIEKKILVSEETQGQLTLAIANAQTLNNELNADATKSVSLFTAAALKSARQLHNEVTKPGIKNITVSYSGTPDIVSGRFAEGTDHAKSGVALVDEEGPELIEHKKQGTYELGSNDGPRFVQLEAGDVVHTAKETEKIKKRGGLSALFGKAFASGGTATVADMAAKLGVKKKDVLALLGGSQSTAAVTTPSKTSSGITVSGNENLTKKSSSSSSSSSKKSSGSSSGSSSSSTFVDKLFDWIEVRLERLERATNTWIADAASAVGYVLKNSRLDSAFDAIKQQIDATTAGYDKYMKQADEIATKHKLSADIIQKVKDGSIEIASYSDAEKQKIQDYQEWYNKAVDCQEALRELGDQQREIASQKLDNVINHYEMRIERLESEIDLTNALIDLKGQEGREIVSSDYNKSISATTEKLHEMSAEYSALSDELANMMAAGYIKEGSDEWYEYTSSLDELNVSIAETRIELGELQDAVNNIKLTNLGYQLDTLKSSAEAMQDFVSLWESQGSHAGASDYGNMIANAFSQISNLEAQNAELAKQMEGLDVLSEKYQELREQIAANNSEILGLKVSQEEWNDAVLDLKINELSEYAEQLQRANDNYQRQRDLMQAIEDLEKAKSQRTVRIFDGEKFVYQADQDAIKDAKDNLDSVLHDQTMAKIDDVISAIEDLKGNTNVYDHAGNLLGVEYELPTLPSYDKTLSDYNAGDIINRTIADNIRDELAQTILSNNGGKNYTISIGDIVLEGVQDSSSLADAIVANLGNDIARALYTKE